MKPGKFSFFLFVFLFIKFNFVYSLEDINLNQLDELPSTFEEVQLTEEEEKYFEENGINLKLENANHNDPIVEIKALDKISAKTTTLKIKIGETVNFENLQIKPIKCKISEFDDTPDTIAYLQVVDITQKENNKVFIFNGWTFSSSPSLRPFDHSVYDLWLVNCYNV